jgi:DNA-binding NtrC family response regulator
VRLSCTSDETFERELFGRIDECEGGTLVLDHLDTASAGTQAKLLHLLESGECKRAGETEPRALEARVVALATGDLTQRVKAGTFRNDLYYRVASFPIALPPLRARIEDLPALVADWLARGPRRRARADYVLSPAAVDVLASYDWPGNVRELENVLERAAIVAGGAAPTPEILRTILESGGQVQAGPNLFEFNIRSNLDAREKELVLGALERTKGKKRDASDLLGIDARNLGYYLRKHKIQDKLGTE